jgi:myo-inositol 2-dehydrogenase/D-chiro-inositol 1-dehydrogenase/scyllo-inositol 2-dehydrogenase (NAD+)
MIHARSYNGNVRDAELIAICDPSEESLSRVQAELAVPYAYTDYNEALKNPEIDAVIVVTPTQFHHDIVIAAAKAKKHVFCEKPMASTEEECDEMIEACRENGVKLSSDFMRRFDKNFRRGRRSSTPEPSGGGMNKVELPTAPVSRRSGCTTSARATGL